MAKIGRQGDGGGRPPRVFSEDEVKKVKELSARLTKGQLADYFNISENTFREVEKRQPEVLEAYKSGKIEQIDEVVGHLLDQCRKGNITGIIFYLKTQAQWSEEQQQNTVIPPMVVETTADNDAPHKAAV